MSAWIHQKPKSQWVLGQLGQNEITTRLEKRQLTSIKTAAETSADLIMILTFRCVSMMEGQEMTQLEKLIGQRRHRRLTRLMAVRWAEVLKKGDATVEGFGCCAAENRLFSSLHWLIVANVLEAARKTVYNRCVWLPRAKSSPKGSDEIELPVFSPCSHVWNKRPQCLSYLTIVWGEDTTAT